MGAGGPHIPTETNLWRVIAMGMLVIFAVACCYIMVTLNTIKTELRDLNDQVGILEKSQDFYIGAIADNQREMLDLLRNNKLTPDDLEKLREEILRK